MPVARIYASLVEEAEPICADLLARGYNVEVVFPDAVLPTPADLELRVERCSAEQAIARVGAQGSPARSVFVTQGKGPRHELLLVEMTVLATGTHGRHPMAMPAAVTPEIALVAAPAAEPESVQLAEVLPFPVLTPTSTESSESVSLEIAKQNISNAEPMLPPRYLDTSDNLGKAMMAELNAFLASAPAVERPDGFYGKVYENVRQSASVARARKNWEGLSLAGIAAAFVGLVALGWFAAPDRSQQPTNASANVANQSVVAPTRTLVSPSPSFSERSSLRASERTSELATETTSRIALDPVVLKTRSSVNAEPAPSRNGVGHRQLPTEDFIAHDSVVNFSTRRMLHKTAPAAATMSELVRPAAIRAPVTQFAARPAPQSTTRSTTQSAPVKVITDLK